jgi:8-oxo-dGTP pyrophosphatase MutT (NUDIX family)
VTTGRASPDPAVDALQHLLSIHCPGDNREARSLATILASLAELPRPFDRHADLTHVTASAIVTGRRGVLLHRHRRLHRWMQPGGHLEPGELPESGARRESVEETGLDLRHPDGGPQLVHVDVHAAADEHVHLDIRFLLIGPDADPAPPPGESQEVRWFSWQEAATIADQSLVGALRSARKLSAAGSVLRSGRTSEETDG